MKVKEFLGKFLVLCVVLVLAGLWGIGGLKAQEVESYVLKLKKGKQFVSFPVVPSDRRIESIFGDILNKIVKIEYYDPEKGKWLCYIPSAPEEVNTLKEIPAGAGFYIEVSNDTQVIIYGNPLKYEDYNLVAGWNPVGVPEEVTPQQLDKNMQDAGLTIRFVLGYDKLYEEVNGTKKEVQIGEKLSPGKGYWINTDPDGDKVASSVEMLHSTNPLVPDTGIATATQPSLQATSNQTEEENTPEHQKVENKYSQLQNKYSVAGENVVLGKFVITRVRYNAGKTEGIGLLENKNLPLELQGLLKFIGGEVLLKLEVKNGKVVKALSYDSKTDSFPGIILGSASGKSFKIQFGDKVKPSFLEINSEGKLTILFNVDDGADIGLPARSYFVKWINGEENNYVRMSTVFGGEALISQLWGKDESGVWKLEAKAGENSTYDWFLEIPAGCKDVFEPYRTYSVVKGNYTYSIEVTGEAEEDPSKWLPGSFTDDEFEVPIDGVYLLGGFTFGKGVIKYTGSKKLILKEDDEGNLELESEKGIFNYSQGSLIVSLGPVSISLHGWNIIPTVEGFKTLNWNPGAVVKIGFSGGFIEEASVGMPISVKITKEIFKLASENATDAQDFKSKLLSMVKAYVKNFEIEEFNTGANTKLTIAFSEETNLSIEGACEFKAVSKEGENGTSFWKCSRSCELQVPFTIGENNQISAKWGVEEGWQSEKFPSIKEIAKFWQEPGGEGYEKEMELSLDGEFAIPDNFPLIGGQSLYLSFKTHFEPEENEWTVQTTAQAFLTQNEATEELSQWQISVEWLRIEFEDVQFSANSSAKAVTSFLKILKNTFKRGNGTQKLKMKKIMAILTLNPAEGSFFYPGTSEATLVMVKKKDYWDVTISSAISKTIESKQARFSLNSLVFKFKWYPGNGTWKEALRKIKDTLTVGGSASLTVAGKTYTGFFLYTSNQIIFTGSFSNPGGVMKSFQIYARVPIPLKKGVNWGVMISGSLSGKALAEALGLDSSLFQNDMQFTGTLEKGGWALNLSNIPFALSRVLPSWIQIKEIKTFAIKKYGPGNYTIEAELGIIMEHFVDKEFSIGLTITKQKGVYLYAKNIGPFDIGDAGEFTINEIKIGKQNGVWEAGGSISYELPEDWVEKMGDVGLTIPEKISLSFTHSGAGFIATGELDPAPSLELPYINWELEVSKITLTNTSPWKFGIEAGLVHGDKYYSGDIELEDGNLVFKLDPGLSFEISLSNDIKLKVSDFQVTLGKDLSFGGKVNVEIPSTHIMSRVFGNNFSAYLEASKEGFKVSTFTNIDLKQNLGSLGEAEFSIDKVSIDSNGGFSGSGFISLAGVQASFVIGTESGSVYLMADFGDQGVSLSLGSIFAIELYHEFGIKTLAGFQTIQIGDINATVGQEIAGISLAGERIVYVLPSSIPPVGFAFFDDLNGNVHIAGFVVNVGVNFPAPTVQDALTVFDAIKGVFTGGSIDWDKLATLKSPSFGLHDIYVAFPDKLKSVFGSNKLVLVNKFSLGPKNFVELATAENAFDVIKALIPKDKRKGSIQLNLLGFKAGASYELKPDTPVYEEHRVPKLQKVYAFLQKASYVDQHAGTPPAELLASGEGIKLVFMDYASGSSYHHRLGHVEGQSINFKQAIIDTVKSFYKSDEYKRKINKISARDYIKSLYHVFLNRDPSSKELKYWLEEYNKALNSTYLFREANTQPDKEYEIRYNEIFSNFLAQQEVQKAIDRIHPTDEEISTFLTKLYKEILGRKPDFEGFYNWKKYLTPGRAWVVNAGETGGGWAIVYGPYISLPPGNYAVSFELKVDDNTLSGNAVGIDVSAEAGKKLLASKKIKYKDFRFPGQYQKFVLFFTLEKGVSGVETRVWRLGTPKCKIYIRRIKIVSGIKKETQIVKLPQSLGGGEAKISWELKDITDQLISLQNLLRDLSPNEEENTKQFLGTVWNRLKIISGNNVKFDYNSEDKCAEAVFPYSSDTEVHLQFCEYDKNYDFTGLKLKNGQLYGKFGKVVLYTKENFNGTSYTPEEDIPYCGNTPVGNDAVESVKIEGRGKAELYQDVRYGGTKIEVTGNVKSLDETGLGNDELSSVKIYFPIDLTKVTKWRIKVYSYDPKNKHAPLFVTLIDAGAIQTIFYNADGSQTVLLGLVPNGPVFSAIQETQNTLYTFNPYPALKDDPGSYLKKLWQNYFAPYLEKAEIHGMNSINAEDNSLTFITYQNKPVTGLKLGKFIERHYVAWGKVVKKKKLIFKNNKNTFLNTLWEKAPGEFVLFAKTGRVILYKDADFKGDSLPVTDDISNLADYGFANTVSSIKMVNATGAKLFSAKDFKTLRAEKVYLYKTGFTGLKFLFENGPLCLEGTTFKPCKWNDDQAFWLVPYGDGYYALRSVTRNNMCLDVFAFAKNDGSNIFLYSCNGYSNQLWKLVKKGNYYYLQAKHSGLCMRPVKVIKNGKTYLEIKQKYCDNDALFAIKHTGTYITLYSPYYVDFNDSWLGDNSIGNDHARSIKVYFPVDTGSGVTEQGALNLVNFNIWNFSHSLKGGGYLQLGRRKIDKKEKAVLEQKIKNKEKSLQELFDLINTKQKEYDSLVSKKERMENKIENINSNFDDIEEIVNNLEARGKALNSIKNLYDAFLFEYSITNLFKSLESKITSIEGILQEIGNYMSDFSIEKELDKLKKAKINVEDARKLFEKLTKTDVLMLYALYRNFKLSGYDLQKFKKNLNFILKKIDQAPPHLKSRLEAKGFQECVQSLKEIIKNYQDKNSLIRLLIRTLYGRKCTHYFYKEENPFLKNYFRQIINYVKENYKNNIIPLANQIDDLVEKFKEKYISELEIEISIKDRAINDLKNEYEEGQKELQKLEDELKNPTTDYILASLNSNIVMLDVKYKNGVFDVIPRSKFATKDGTGFFPFPFNNYEVIVNGKTYSIKNLAEVSQYVRIIEKTYYIPPDNIRVDTNGKGAFWAKYDQVELAPQSTGSSFTVFSLKADDESLINFRYGPVGGTYVLRAYMKGKPIPTYKENNQLIGVRKLIKIIPGGFFADANLQIDVKHNNQSLLYMGIFIKGQIKTDGSFYFGGNGSLIIGGYEVANAKVVLSSKSGLYVKGRLQISSQMYADIEGRIEKTSSGVIFSFAGKASLVVGGEKHKTGLVGSLNISNSGLVVAGSVYIGGYKIRSATFAVKDGRISWQESVGVGFAGVKYTIWVLFKQPYGAGCSGNAFLDADVPIKIFGPIKWEKKSILGIKVWIPVKWGWKVIGHIRTHFTKEIARASIEGSKIKIGIWEADLVLDLAGPSLKVEW